MKSYPTYYKGRRYRSRLEARWAVFFDYLGWNIEYEPLDYDGWIPDFAIYGKELVLAEVKPVKDINKAVIDEITTASKSEHEVLLLGLKPFEANGYGYLVPMIGWLGEKVVEGGRLEWSGAPLGLWGDGKIIGFCSQNGSYHDRITGKYQGGHYGNGELLFGEIELLWNQATNKVQWLSGDKY